MNKLQLQVILSAVDKLTAPLRSTTKEVGQLASTLKLNRSELATLQKQMRANETTIEKYNAKLNPLKTALAQTNSQLAAAKNTVKNMETAMAGMAAPSEAFKNKLNQARLTVEKLKQTQTTHAQKLRAVRLEMEKNGVSSKQLSQNQQNLKGKINQATESLKKQNEQLAKLNQRAKENQIYSQRVEGLRNTSDKMKNLGQQSMITGAAFIAPVAKVVKDYSNLEDAMAGVARQVPGLKDEASNLTPEYYEWQQKIKKIAETLPVTTVEVAAMVEAAARMDVPKDELLDFVKLSTQMATAFDAANPDQLVEQFGKVSKNFKLDIKGTQELADSINFLDDNAISKGTDIIEFLNRTAGVAGSVKITAKNLAALGSTLQTAGATAETSGTAVKSIFTKLAQVSKDKTATKALKMMGLNANEIETGMIKDAQGALFKIIDALKQMPEQKRLGLMADLVDSVHANTLSLLVSNTEEYRRQIALANSEEAKGSMGREYITRLQTLSAQFTIFRNKIFNTNSVIGQSLREQLIAVMDSLGALLSKVQAWIELHPELTAQLIKFTAIGGVSLITIGALLNVLGFLLYPIGRLILGFLKLTRITALLNMGATWLLTGFKNFILPLGRIIFSLKNLGLIFTALRIGVIALFSPFGILATVLITAGSIIYNNWQPIKNFFTEFFLKIGEGLNQLKENAKQFASGFISVFNFLLNPVQALINGLEKLKNLLPSLDSIKTTASRAWQHFTENQTTPHALGVPPLGMYRHGGYVGAGATNQIKGLVHGGEYVITKEATERLGLPLLNALNYTKGALIAGGLGLNIAQATPITPTTQVSAPTVAPFTVNITINATEHQNGKEIAQEVAKQIEQLQQRQQLAARSRLIDWD